jgi:hypothetical protein
MRKFNISVQLKSQAISAFNTASATDRAQIEREKEFDIQYCSVSDSVLKAVCYHSSIKLLELFK